MKINFKESEHKATDVLVIPVYDGKILGDQGTLLDSHTDLSLKDELEIDPKFEGKRGQTLTLTSFPATNFKRIVLLGMGKDEGMEAQDVEMLAGPLNSALSATGFENVHFLADTTGKMDLTEEQLAATLGNAMRLKSYNFDKYKTVTAGTKIDNVSFIVNDPAKAKALYEPLEKVSDGVDFARDLANEPGNKLYPLEFADRIRKELKSTNVNTKLIDKRQMEKLGMGAALAVGQGSQNDPCMVVMEYNGSADKNQTPLALVGKGVTFDSGGISLKPGAGMDEMKFDMGGAAAVVGAMKALAGRGAKSNVVAIVALAENMPGPNAIKPGDIVTSMSGATIEILNTDAEGRLVMCDALTYIQQKYEPDTVLDLATLTGACVAALGHEYAGVFTENDDLAAKLDDAGKQSSDYSWRLPLNDNFKKEVIGKYGDLQNMGRTRYGGASTAAGFLSNFFNKEAAAAHLDIAGMAWGLNNHAVHPNSIGSGFGVRWINQLVANDFEDKPKQPAAKPGPQSSLEA